MTFAFSRKMKAASLVALALAGGASAQTAATNARPAVRITESVNNTLTTRLEGSRPAVVEHAIVGARLASSTPLKSMRLVLSPTDAQVVALHSLMEEQQDKTSPNYHKWLTPQAYGEHFGAAPEDVAKVTAWLQGQGFSVDSVAKSNRLITFSGTAGQVETAFHTQMNSVTVEGETHISNVTDIAVPSALASVVKGVAALNDFFPKTKAIRGGTAQIPVQLSGNNYVYAPQFGTSATGTHYVTPGDAAVIFNTTPLTTAGIDGTGVNIAVLARSNIALGDVQAFRTLFGLKKNDPNFIVVGSDPGDNGDDEEADLDAEWAGAMAPNATVNFIVAGPSLISGGTDGAALYAVENNIGDIISLSYGGCEKNFTLSGTTFWNQLWEQAAAQGQTVFISTGDSGAATCDSSGATYATGGYGVNALGSSAYNVAVGGSMFVDYSPATYWGTASAIPYASAQKYIPEAAWNQGLLTTTLLNSAATAAVSGSGIVGTGGGISVYTARPPWQTGNGIPATDPVPVTGTGKASVSDDPGYTAHRLVPDISLIAANGHDGSLYCGNGICAISGGALGNAGIIGGTSVATPVMASMQALINQKNGGRQGNANYFYYPLANKDYLAGNCQAVNGTAASPTVTLPASTCNFHDIVAGSNLVPTTTAATPASATPSIGFSAGVGFDEASGLGTLNAYNLATNWNTVTHLATTSTIVKLSPAITTHGTSMQLSVKVAPTTGSGTPTGDFSIIPETTTPYTATRLTLTSGAYTGTLPFLPAGSYNVHVHYAGDGTYSASDSASVPVVISKENSSVLLASYNVVTSGASAGSIAGTSSFPYGSLVYVDTEVQGSSGSGAESSAGLPAGTVPSGTVNFTITRNGTAITPLTTTLDTYGTTFLEAANSYSSYYLKANYPALSPGSYVVTAAYSGDTSFNATSSSVAFTVTQLTPTVSYTGTSNITSGGKATYSFAITTPTTLSTAATGTVYFTDTTTASTLGNCTLSNGACSFSTTAITATGGNTITAVYSGDVNYATASGTVTTTVGTLTSQTVAVSTSGTLAVNTAATLIATLGAATTGSVQFYDGSTLIGTATATSATTTYSITYGLFAAGSHTITANFLGNTSYTAATGSASLTIAKFTPSIYSLAVALNTTYGQTVAAQTVFTYTTNTGYLTQPTGTITFTDVTNSLTAGTSTTFTLLPNNPGRLLTNVLATVLTGGTHAINVSYSGDANFAAVTSTNQTITVAALTPTVALTSTAAVFNGTTSVPLTATIPGTSVLAAPSGLVTFYDGSTQLGTATAAYNATAGAFVATYTATSQSGGPHAYKAVLASDSNYNTATSNILSVLVTTNNVWVANGNNTVSGLTQTGSAVTSSAQSGGGTAIAIDNAGDVWSLNKSANAVSEYSNAGVLISSGSTVGGLNAPTALAIDGSGLVWVTNGSGTLSVLSAPGTAVSPTAGYKVSASTPTSITIDQSGNLWITNSGDNSVTEVIGAATPVTTPTTNAVKSNTLAAKP